MKKKIVVLILITIMILAYLSLQSFKIRGEAAQTYIKALPTSSQVLVNGNQLKLEAYNINGNNYFKLRDIAFALDGSAKQFDVVWNANRGSIDLLTGKVYTAFGGELSVPASPSSKMSLLSSSKIYVDGIVKSIAAYNINGNNYFQLRDLGRTINFKVSWNGSANAIVIDTTKDYGQQFFVSTDGNDKNQGTITNPWRTIQKAANSAFPGDTIFIRGGTYNEHVVLKISGTSESYITFSNYGGEAAIVDGTGIDWGKSGALFDVSGTAYIKILGLRIINSSWAGIGTPFIGANNIIIKNCSTYRTQTSGIIITNGSNIIVDGNTIDTPNLYPQDEGLSISHVDTFEVKNNTIINAKKESLDAKDGSKNGKIYNNIIRDGAGVGIYIDAFSRTSGNIEIYNNSVTNCTYGIWLANETGGLLTDINTHHNTVSYCQIGMGIGYYFESYAHPMEDISFSYNTLSWIISRGVSLENPEAKNISITNNILDGTNDCIPIYLGGGNSAETYIDGNALNKVVTGQPTGSNFTLINK